MRVSIPVCRPVVLTLALLLVFATSTWAALTNGDFEAGSASWTVTSGPVEFSIDEGASPGEGTATLIENANYSEEGFSLTSFGQTFTLEPGDAILSFDYDIRLTGGGEPPESDDFTVSLNGMDHEVASTHGAEYVGEFLSGTWFFDVSSLPRGDTTLAFNLLGELDDFLTTVEVDNVTLVGPVSTVPAPGALLLVGLGAALVGHLRCRRAL
jgi:hypothetical protein